MNIYIDESGSFVNALATNKWNAVAALAVPEAGRKKLDSLVRQLRVDSCGTAANEVKLNEVTEER